MTIPSIAEAHAVLAEARTRNPGPWADHCQVAASVARAIAAHHPTLEPERAYVLALLHDVGRGRGGPGTADVRHIMDGYAAMHERGFLECARICLTHSFPIKDTAAFAGAWDCLADEKRFVQDYLDGVEYTDYDRLVQLCDALALPSGPCLMEKRLVDVALRHGFNRLTQAKWRAYLALLEQFSQTIGASVYTVLPGVVETTFSSPPG